MRKILFKRISLKMSMSSKKVFGIVVFLEILALYFYLFNVSIIFLLGLGFLGLVTFIWAIELNYIRYEEIILCLLLIAGLSVNAVVASSDLLLIGVLFSSFSIAAAVNAGSINSKMARIIFIIFVLSMIYSIFILRKNGNDIFAAGSRNYISAISIYFAAMIYLTDHIEKRKIIVIWPMVFSFLLSVYAIGRSGIGISGLLLVLVLFVRYKQFYKRRTMLALFFIVVLIIFLSYLVYEYIWDYIFLIYSKSRFAYNGMESPRFVLWKSFFRDLNFHRAIFGFDLNEIPEISAFNGNPHNSFIKIWARAGLPGFILNIIIFLSSIKLFIRHKFIGFIFFMVLLRAFFDIIVLINWLDFVLFSFLFYVLRDYYGYNDNK